MDQKIYQIDEIKSKLYPIFEAMPVYRAILFGYKPVDLFEISEVSRNATICSAIEREGIVLYVQD